MTTGWRIPLLQARRGIARALAMVGALLPAAALLGAAPGAALDAGPDRPSAAEVAVRAAAHPGYGRLVLEWPHPVEVELTETAGSAILSFSARLTGDLGPARGPLAPWLRAAEIGDDGRVLRLALAPGARPRLAQWRPELVVVDLEHPGGGEAPAVELRTGRHDGFMRLVFDWGERIGFSAVQNGRELTLTFDRPGRIDDAEIGRRLPEVIEQAGSQREDAATRVRLRLAPGVGARTFAVEGRQVVVDLKPPERAAEVSGPDPAPTAGAGDPSSAAAVPTPPPGGPAPVLAGPEPGSVGSPSSGTGRSSRASEVAAAGGPIEPSPARGPPGVVLEIAWARPVAAAAFVRGGHLWLVFDAAESEASGPLPPPLEPAVAARLGQGQRVASANGTALRFALREPGAITAAREGATWRFTLGAHASAPAAVPQRRLLEPARLRLDAAGGGELVRLIDPAIGDRLIVWPLLEAGRGQPEHRRLVELELLPTIQGVVLRPASDALEVRKIEAGIELGGGAGLSLSHLPGGLDPPAADAAAEPAEDVPLAVRPPADIAPAAHDATPPFLGLATFALRRGESVAGRRAELMGRAARAPAGEREGAELDLARFFLAQAMAPETFAVLALASADAGAERPAHRAIRGAAAVLAGRVEPAAGALGAPEFDHDPELALWRAALAAAERDWPRAARELDRAEATLESYPPPLQMRLGLTAALILIENGRPEAAVPILDLLAASAPHGAERARITFVRGLAEARLGVVDHATLLWRSLEDRQVPEEVRIDAGHARVRLLLDAGRIDQGEALAQLAAARPRWHGHPEEAAMLDTLAGLHLRDGDPVSAIRTWQAALPLDPEPARRMRMAAAARDAFGQALLGGDAGVAGAVRALALYRDLSDLLPEGAAGMEMRRRLARRLAAFDLIEPAATLLEEVLESELEPADRARAGLELAALRLAEPDPAAALEALDATGAGVLPPPLLAERELMRGRALLGLERLREALAALSGRDDGAAQRLRAAIHWSQGDWAGSVAALEAVLHGRPGREEPLSVEEETLVAQLALAYARLRHADGLARLRERFGAAMRGREGEPAFLLATLGDGGASGPGQTLAAVDRRVDALRAWLQRP